MPTPTSVSSLPNSATQHHADPAHPQSQPPSRSTSTTRSKSHSKSRPATPTSSTLATSAPPKSQRPKLQSRASSAILAGAERLLALFDEEREKNDARHKAQLLDLETRFQEFRAGAETEQRRLTARVQELEAGGQEKGKGKSADVLEGPANSAMLSQIDEESAWLLRQLALHLSQVQAGGGEAEPTPAQVEVPDAFVPAFAQYLAAHNKALLEWVEKCRVIGAERDLLREKNKEKRRKIRELEKILFFAERKGEQRHSSGYVRPPDSGSGSEHGGDEGADGGGNEGGQGED